MISAASTCRRHALRRHLAWPGQRRGVAAVEFAVVLPLFLVMVVGILEYGRMLTVQQVLSDAAREGARVAATQGAATTDVLAAVNNCLETAAITGATIDVSPRTPSSAGGGQPVSVSIALPFGEVSFLHSASSFAATTLSARCTMRSENP